MIRLRAFQGRIPKLHPTLLPDAASVVCHNARMRSGALVPFRNQVTSDTLPAAKASITKISGYWRGYTSRASVVQGPVVESRAYVSGDGAPRVESYLAGSIYSYALASPRPVLKPTVAVLSGTVVPANKESILFAYTWVTVLNEESAPSPLSSLIDYSPTMAIRLSAFSAAPAGRGIDRKRIYRSVTDYSGTTTLFFVAEIAAAATTFDYVLETYPVQEPIATTDYDTPVAGIKGFTALPNGMVAGFLGRKLFFSEPFRPHAWPDKYSLTLDYDIVGLSAFGSTLAIMTTGTPYTTQGTHPSNMLMTKIEQNLPCVSALGIVDMGYSAAYPSNDGLVVITTQGAQLASTNLFTREDWQALKPASFIASLYEGRYVFLRQPAPGAARDFGMIDLSGESPFYLTCDGTGADLFYEIESGDLFVLGIDGVSIRRFDDPTGTRQTYIWRSKRLAQQVLTNFGYCRIEADTSAGATTVFARLYGNDESQIGLVSTIGAAVRMPSGRLDDIFSVELEGTASIYSVGYGNTPDSLIG